jgi:hypothetical protein
MVHPQSKKSKIAFVISPIGEPESPERKRSDQILKHVITPVTSSLGYETIRADQISKPGVITSQIIEHLLDDQIVIADLSGSNPNVVYELATRHTLKKPAIQLAKKGDKIPFDVSNIRLIQIDHQDLDSVAEAKVELQKHIESIEKNPGLIESPFSVAIDIRSLRESGNPEQNVMAEIRMRLQEMSFTMSEIGSGLQRLEGQRFSTARPTFTFSDEDSALGEAFYKWAKYDKGSLDKALSDEVVKDYITMDQKRWHAMKEDVERLQGKKKENEKAEKKKRSGEDNP